MLKIKIRHFFKQHFMFAVFTAVIFFKNYLLSWGNTRRKVTSTHLFNLLKLIFVTLQLISNSSTVAEQPFPGQGEVCIFLNGTGGFFVNILAAWFS